MPRRKRTPVAEVSDVLEVTEVAEVAETVEDIEVFEGSEIAEVTEPAEHTSDATVDEYFEPQEDPVKLSEPEPAEVQEAVNAVPRKQVNPSKTVKKRQRNQPKFIR